METSPLPADRFLTVHGHFYQPGRENPWLEWVEREESAHPFHDWNERVAAECYAPNSAARILGAHGTIAEIANNYARLSFDFGPTLLRWLALHTPATYRAILAADAESLARCGGHGNAIAQSYHHAILPLAPRRDKVTEVAWGLKDFETRFGRPAEGIWLPETAVDAETLGICAEAGIVFTILSPYQARRIRRIGETAWTEVTGGRIDPTRPYRFTLPGGRSVALFFYDGPISHGLAFEGLLGSGEQIVERIARAYDDARPGPQLLHLATDGESYGHHHRFGEMALAYALREVEARKIARLTNYGAFLAAHPPTHEVEIVEASSWSCAHGVERWRADCGCGREAHRGWHQRWRAPLREALDWLRSELDPLFESRAAPHLHDPWAARDDYGGLLVSRSPDRVEDFLQRHQRRPLGSGEQVRLLTLLEMQRHALQMYASDAWFFEELSRPEPIQALRHAALALHIAEELGRPLERPFCDRLARVEGNIPRWGDAARIYRERVRPARTDVRRVAAHAALHSCVVGEPPGGRLYCFTIRTTGWERRASGKATVLLARLHATSEVTGEEGAVTAAVLCLGGHDLRCSLREPRAPAVESALAERLWAALPGGSVTEVIRAMDEEFGPEYYTLRDLFSEERTAILMQIAREGLEPYEDVARRLYQENRPLMEYLKALELPIPHLYLAAARQVLEADLGRLLATCSDRAAPQELVPLAEEATRWGIDLDWPAVERCLRRLASDRLQALLDDPAAADPSELLDLLDWASRLPVPLQLWELQNTLYAVLSAVRAEDSIPGRAATLAPDRRAALSAFATRLNLPPLPAHTSKSTL